MNRLKTYALLFGLAILHPAGRLFCQEAPKGYFYVYPNNASAYPESTTLSKNNALNNLFATYKVEQYRKSFPRAKTPSLQNAYEIHFTGNLENFKATLQATNQFSKIEVAPYYQTAESSSHESQMTVCTPVTINDPNADWALDAIEARCAWSITTGSSAIPVAIVDTEFDTSHQDLKYPNGSSKIISLWLDPYWNTHTLPNCAHGTQVAGMAASQPNNGVFGAGIGYNTSIAGYIPYNEQGFPSGCGIAPWSGVWQAYLDGRRIINVSAEGIYDVSVPQTIIDAITEITSNGSLIVVSAANSSYHNPYSNIPGVIHVSGINSDLNSAGPYNAFVDICAPSINVKRIQRVNSDGPGWETSLAAPIVSGTAALMLNVNSCLTPAEMETLIKLSALPIIDADQPGEPNFGLVGAGRLNSYRAVRYASGDFDAITTNTTWSTPMYANGNITVEAGATLTIKTKVRFGSNAKITVKKGGKLVVDRGHLTSGCAGYWQGIEVLGDPSVLQFPTLQGVIELKPFSIIENANNAITTGTNGVGNQGGGRIEASLTTFRNNRRSVEFLQ